ncbi:MAG TPA: hypothetical protein EYQ86_03070 [Bacteroidetes bacterium]|nr:hypothetical protein [Bacteroidota bacterium]
MFIRIFPNTAKYPAPNKRRCSPYTLSVPSRSVSAECLLEINGPDSIPNFKNLSPDVSLAFKALASLWRPVFKYEIILRVFGSWS